MEFSIDRKRAQAAWANLQEVEAAKCGEDYYSLIRGFPTRVQADGIGQAVAFLMAKRAEKAHSLLLHHLRSWLATGGELPWSEANRQRLQAAGPQTLIELLLGEPSTFWWLADRETIEFCSWLKRYSEFYHREEVDRVAANRS